MDLLRSCYTQPVSYVQGDSTIQVPGRWYFADPRATPFPGPHAFASGTWDNVHPTITTLGFDATQPRVYDNGRRFNVSDGTKFAGPKDYFLNGAPAPQALERGVNGTPKSCLLRPFGKVIRGLGRTGAGCFGKVYALALPFEVVQSSGPPCDLLKLSGYLTWRPKLPPSLFPLWPLDAWMWQGRVGTITMRVALFCNMGPGNWQCVIEQVGLGREPGGITNPRTRTISIPMVLPAGFPSGTGCGGFALRDVSLNVDLRTRVSR